MGSQYVVIGAYVTAEHDVDGQRVISGFLQGAPLPDSVPQQTLDHLVDVNLVKRVDPYSEDVNPQGTPPATTAAPAVVEKPNKSASKPDWVDYAVAQGQSRDLAESKSRDDLAAEYA